MKKLMIGMLICVMSLAFTACGTKEEKPLDTPITNEDTSSDKTELNEETIVAVVEAKNCFADAGFIELIAGVAESAEYTFTTENSDDTEWSVYILDEAFDDSFRYIKQVTDPVLENDGTIFIDEGKYVYVYCSANEFTTGVADENAKLKITLK